MDAAQVSRSAQYSFFSCRNCSVLVLLTAAVGGGVIVALAGIKLFGSVNSIGFILATSLGGSCVLISGTAVATIIIASCRKHAVVQHNKAEAIKRAIWEKNGEQVQQLLEEVNEQFINRHYLLHEAVEFGNAEIVGCLIDKGANVRTVNQFDEEPIDSLPLNESGDAVAILDMLCAQGATFDTHEKRFICRCASARRDVSELIKHSVVDLKADVNKETIYGRPLEYAARLGLACNVDALLECGANPAAKNIIDETALHSAEQRLQREDSENNRAIVKSLKEAQEKRKLDLPFGALNF